MDYDPLITVPPAPLLAVAQVTEYDSEAHSVYVHVPSWQMPAFPARLLINGNADAYRLNQQPLPVTGTWGIVALLFGDYRNAVWMGAILPWSSQSGFETSTDAIASSVSGIDSQMEYFSHWSGYYRLLDGVGNLYQRFPDGTNMIMGTQNSAPTIYRHVADSDGTRKRVVFPDSLRTSTPPSAYYVILNHASGTQVQVEPNGNLIANVKSSQVLELQVGNSMISADNNNIQLTTSGASLTVGSNQVNINPLLTVPNIDTEHIDYTSVGQLGSVTQSFP